MAAPKSSQALQETIAWLEKEQANKQLALKEQFNQTYESLKPINVMKDTLKDFTQSSSTIGDFVIPLLGLGTGYLTKRLISGKSEDPQRLRVAEALGNSVTSAVAQHPEEIIAFSKFMLRFILGKPKPKDSDAKQ